MVSSLLKMGIRSLDRFAATTAAASAPARRHPLAAYPQLHSLLAEAERTGSLAAERRRLMGRYHSN